MTAGATAFSEILWTLKSRGGGFFLRKNPLGSHGAGLHQFRKCDKARVDSEALSARLKSCPDTKPDPDRVFTKAVKPALYAALTARLKPYPSKLRLCNQF